MPQMSPMLWSLLFIYFILLFLFFNILNYFNFIPSIQKESPLQVKMLTNNKILTWKW